MAEEEFKKMDATAHLLVKTVEFYNRLNETTLKFSDDKPWKNDQTSFILFTFRAVLFSFVEGCLEETDEPLEEQVAKIEKKKSLNNIEMMRRHFYYTIPKQRERKNYDPEDIHTGWLLDEMLKFYDEFAKVKVKIADIDKWELPKKLAMYSILRDFAFSFVEWCFNEMCQEDCEEQSFGERFGLLCVVKDLDYYVGKDADDLTDEELLWTIIESKKDFYDPEKVPSHRSLKEYAKDMVETYRYYSQQDHVVFIKQGNYYFWWIY